MSDLTKTTHRIRNGSSRNRPHFRCGNLLVPLIVLLLALVIGQAGPTALVLIRHQRGQRRVEALRTRTRSDEEDADLTHLTVPMTGSAVSDSALVRVGRREVRFEGHLYDVAFEVRRGDTMHLWVHHDRAEEMAVARVVRTLGRVAQGTGIAVASPLPERFLCLPSALAARRPPILAGIRRAPTGVRAARPPFSEVLHPPPRA